MKNCIYEPVFGLFLLFNFQIDSALTFSSRLITEPTLKSQACLKCLYLTIIIFDLCRYLEYFSYLSSIKRK